ncbi:MAG: hypothetical protein H8E26_00245 [FCB group bacterium]|nr:hypothetical protein [FCB group bacterium]
MIIDQAISASDFGCETLKGVNNDGFAFKVFTFEGNLSCPHCGALLHDASLRKPGDVDWDAGVMECPHVLYTFGLVDDWRGPIFLSVRPDWAKSFIEKLIHSPKYLGAIGKHKKSPLKGGELAAFVSGNVLELQEVEWYPVLGSTVARFCWHLPSYMFPELMPDDTVMMVAGESTSIHIAISPTIQPMIKLP